jgi:hypothetical protein
VQGIESISEAASGVFGSRAAADESRENATGATESDVHAFDTAGEYSCCVPDGITDTTDTVVMED